MKPEQEQLIDDVLGADGRREATLLAGSKVLRRRRQGRAARRFLAMAMLVGAVLLLFDQRNRQPPPVQVSVQEKKPDLAPQVKFITDEELLAMFPNTPVGLAKLSDGKKILIFPRPGDDARFISRL